MHILLHRLYVLLLLVGNLYIMKHRTTDKVEAIEIATQEGDNDFLDNSADAEFAGSSEMESDPFDPLNTPPIVAYVMPAQMKDGKYDDVGPQEAIPFEMFDDMDMGATDAEVLL